jgi:TRAP-type C4-dicarboxylate transport system permease large subunit
MLIVKVIIVILLISIFFALGSALYYLMRDQGNSDRIVKALTWRIGLSLLLFVLILAAYAMGWITPNQV